LHAHNGPHDGILLLEEHIEELHAKIESCQKFILASRIAVVGGGIVLVAMLVGAIRFDLGTMAAAVAAFLGGLSLGVQIRPRKQRRKSSRLRQIGMR
jgi:hypothetical protein